MTTIIEKAIDGAQIANLYKVLENGLLIANSDTQKEAKAKKNLKRV